MNHNGSAERALAMVDAAAAAGADAVKFQTFRAAELISRLAPKADYQLRATDAGESQLEMVRKLELSEAAHMALIEHAEQKRIRFLSTPFDIPSLQFLTERLGLDTIKISSGEITNAPFLVEIAKTGREVILSTGMSTMEEVELALGALAFGYVTPAGVNPGARAFKETYESSEGQKRLRARVSLLHCTSEYPASYEEVNLQAMESLSEAFGLPVGLSDHTQGIHIPIAAVARGARIIEKHFTLDRNLPGPDHAASLEPDELKSMVRAIRDVESALGDGNKRPSAAEWKNREVVRRSLVAAKPIRKGDLFTQENVACKRPGTGVSPFAYWQVLGKTAERNYDTDETLDA